MNENNNRSGIVSTGAKVLQINVDEEFIENSLIDIPFIYYYKSKDIINAVRYQWTTSEGINREIQVRSSIHGVPTPYEYDVLLALFRLYIKQNNNKIVRICNDKDFENIDNRVHFTYTDLILEMGYSGRNSQLKKKIEKSIETLCDTNIYNTAHGGLYNPITKEYITDGKFQVGILNGYVSYNYIPQKDENGNILLDENGNPVVKLNKKSVRDKCSVKIDPFFLRNLLYGNGKISDKNLRLSLKNDVARKIYLILNKWRNNRREMYLKFDTLYHRIPLTDEKSDYYRKRRVIDGLNELVGNGYIESYEKIREGVNIVFALDIRKNVKESKNLLSEYNTYEEIVAGFNKYNVDENSFNRYFKIHKIPYYQALLRYVDDRLNTIDSPKAYVLKGLIIEYKDIDKKYYNKD